MKIVVNDIAASSSGAMTVLKSFYRYVRENDRVNEYIFLLSNHYLEETDRIKIIVLPNVKKSRLHKLYFDLLYGKKYLFKLNADRVVSLQNIMTFGYQGIQDVFIHQAIPFQERKRFSFLKREEALLAKYQYIVGGFIKQSAKRARKVYVQTAWMKQAVIAKTGVVAEKVFVVPPEAEAAINCRYTPQCNRFFYPATDENVYKNQKCIYEASKTLLRRGYPNFKTILTLDKGHQPIERCEFVGLIEKEEMYQYYTTSVLVFPSYIETVGLPLIEARTVGAIILAADCEYAHEILDDYPNAYFFDPFVPSQLADLMEKMITGMIKAENPKGVGGKVSELNSWEILLKELIE